jgi:hypothetical protein
LFASLSPRTDAHLSPIALDSTASSFDAPAGLVAADAGVRSAGVGSDTPHRRLLSPSEVETIMTFYCKSRGFTSHNPGVGDALAPFVLLRLPMHVTYQCFYNFARAFLPSVFLPAGIATRYTRLPEHHCVNLLACVRARKTAFGMGERQ